MGAGRGNGFGAACWRDLTEKQGASGSKAPTRAPSAREKPGHVGVGGRGNKALPGAKRQQRRRQPGKNRPVLAWPDGETKRCREQSANNGAVSPGKTGPCWRDRTEKQGVAGSKAPTKAPSARENPGPVGVGGRGNKALPGAKRQHGRRQPGKNLGLLAWPDEETRIRGEQGANMGAVSPGKTWACWRGRTEKQGFPRSEAPTMAPSARENPVRVGVTGRRNKVLPGAKRQQRRRQPGKNRSVLAWPDEEARLPEERGANMPCRATLIHAAFRKAEEIDDEKGEKGEFAVNSFYFGRKKEESDARRALASVHHFLPYAHTSLTWCFTLAKALIIRRGAPRRPRPAGHRLVRRGASPSSKP